MLVYLDKYRDGALVLLSGGVDSSVLTSLAYKQLNNKVIALTFDSPLTPKYMLEASKKLAGYLGVNHIILKTNEIYLERFRFNPIDRCYLCKKYRLMLARSILEKHKFKYILDGTTYSEVSEYRPGLKVLNEEDILEAPFIDLKISKDMIRKIAYYLGIPTADYPPDSCLATRIVYGEELNIVKLRKVDRAEEYIRKIIGLKPIRVRLHSDIVRIEVPHDSFYDIVENWREIVNKFHELDFKYITLDLEGYRSGSFDIYLK